MGGLRSEMLRSRTEHGDPKLSWPSQRCLHTLSTSNPQHLGHGWTRRQCSNMGHANQTCDFHIWWAHKCGLFHSLTSCRAAIHQWIHGPHGAMLGSCSRKMLCRIDQSQEK